MKEGGARSFDRRLQRSIDRGETRGRRRRNLVVKGISAPPQTANLWHGSTRLAFIEQLSAFDHLAHIDDRCTSSITRRTPTPVRLP